MPGDEEGTRLARQVQEVAGEGQMSEEEARSLLRRCSAVAEHLAVCPDPWNPEAAADGALLGEGLQTLAGHCAPAALPRLLLGEADGAGHPLARAAAALQLLWVAAEPDAPAGGAATSAAPPPPQREQTLCALCAGLAAVLEPLHAISQTAEQPVAQDVSLKSHLRMVCSVALSLAKVVNHIADRGAPTLAVQDIAALELLAQVCSILEGQLGKGQLPHEASAPLADALVRLVTKQHSYFYALVMRCGGPDPRNISLSFAVDPETGEKGVALEIEEPADSAPGWVQDAVCALHLLVAHQDSTALAVTKDMVQRLFRHRDEAVGSEQHFKLISSPLMSAVKGARWLVHNANTLDPEQAVGCRFGLLMHLDRLLDAALTPRIFACEAGELVQDPDLTRHIQTWGMVLFAGIPAMGDVYAVLRNHPSMADHFRGHHLLWHVLHYAHAAGLQDLLVRAGGGRLLRFWLEDILASPCSNELLDNAYIPKACWMITHESPGLTLALLKDGCMRLLLDRVERDLPRMSPENARLNALTDPSQRGIPLQNRELYPCPCGCGQTQYKEPPIGCAWEVVWSACDNLDACSASPTSLARERERLMGRHMRPNSMASSQRAVSQPRYWQDVKATLVGPMEQVARREWARQEGLDAQGAPLPGALPLNTLYRDVAVSAISCCSPACLNLGGPAEAAVRRLKCGGCGRASYCGSDCQRADWGRHKAACRQLRRMG